jgi:hypothetical protein
MENCYIWVLTILWKNRMLSLVDFNSDFAQAFLNCRGDIKFLMVRWKAPKPAT